MITRHYQGTNMNLLKELTSLLETKRARAKLNEAAEKRSLKDLVDAYCEQNKFYHFEGPRGIKNFEQLVSVISYNDLDNFLEDNSGAIEAVIQWINDQDNDEWKEELVSYLKYRDDEDDEDTSHADNHDMSEIVDQWCDENKAYHFEGPRGVANLTKLVRAIGYNQSGHGHELSEFFGDNSGAIQAMVDWMSNFPGHEWKEEFAAHLHESKIVGDLVESLSNKSFTIEPKKYSFAQLKARLQDEHSDSDKPDVKVKLITGTESETSDMLAMYLDKVAKDSKSLVCMRIPSGPQKGNWAVVLPE